MSSPGSDHPAAPQNGDMTSPEHTPQLPSPVGGAASNPIQTFSPRLAGIVRRHGDGHRAAPILAQGGVTSIATLTAGYVNGSALLKDISTSKISSHWRGANLHMSIAPGGKDPRTRAPAQETPGRARHQLPNSPP